MIRRRIVISPRGAAAPDASERASPGHELGAPRGHRNMGPARAAPAILAVQRCNTAGCRPAAGRARAVPQPSLNAHRATRRPPDRVACRQEGPAQ
ncbi:hypothetical protein CJO84_20040 (plasmid) [Ralstonia solanacearum]|nr:hypothetical protein CJO84_20040 [Ralstonia solanacearum]